MPRSLETPEMLEWRAASKGACREMQHIAQLFTEYLMLGGENARRATAFLPSYLY